MSKILITGGAGFIGYHLANVLLAGNNRVDLLDNFSRGVVDTDLKSLTANPRVKLINTDLLQKSSLDELDTDYHYIYHLAAIVGVSHVLDKPYEVMHDNTMMLLNILSLAKLQSRLERLVFASTSEVYAGTLQYFSLPIPTTENTPLAVTDINHPRTSYMLSKIYGEALCRFSDIPFTVIRPHNLYGPRMGLSHVIPELLHKAYSGSENLEVVSAGHRRTFCYIADAVEMIKRAAEREACAGETLNIGTQYPELSIGQLAEIILRVVARNLRIIRLPATSGSPARRCPDMSKTTELTGYVPRIGLEDGVRRTFDWYRSHVFDGQGVTAR